MWWGLGKTDNRSLQHPVCQLLHRWLVLLYHRSPSAPSGKVAASKALRSTFDGLGLFKIFSDVGTESIFGNVHMLPGAHSGSASSFPWQLSRG